MKIIETSIIYNDLTLCDHQSRVIEVSSWEEYCSLYLDYDGSPVGLDYECIFPQMVGYVLPKDAYIIDLMIEDYRLACNMILPNGENSYKLAYVVTG